MRLGIDVGTTRIVVAAVDRGNYPVVSFEDAEGGSRDWFPPLVATRDSKRLYGWEAWAAQTEPGYTVVRSLKRTLEGAGPATLVEVDEDTVPLQQLLEEAAMALRRRLVERSSLRVPAGETLEVMLGVPANANSNQRFLTVEPFQRAGFTVLGLLNEPSAASIEYGHGSREAGTSERVLVYDLGGGTFDASLVEIEDRVHTVVASDGVPTLGGDDFDMVLADMALEAASVTPEARDRLTQAESFRLYEECRTRKEALNPNTRRIMIDLGAIRVGWGEITVSAADYYERCRPMVEKTLEATESLLAAYDEGSKLDAVYVTGGGSELPLVARVLRERFGRKVKRSPYTRSATAIGLAIQADSHAGYLLREKFTRHFGVWRETQAGHKITFDSLFAKGTALPGPGEPPLVITRNYCPVHNIGHFRYLECSQRSEAGEPAGDIAVWDEIRFPFDPFLKDASDLHPTPIRRGHALSTDTVEETYTCDSSGSVAVVIRNLTSGYQRQYRLGHWSGKEAAITPGKKKRAASKR